ncbi:hypothetical protein EDF70_11825 [Neorhizobium sp. JUb45]|nr:hypothetical protein EDF70_11825 [Neorhizobium sp. JUb45]
MGWVCLILLVSLKILSKIFDDEFQEKRLGGTYSRRLFIEADLAVNWSILFNTLFYFSFLPVAWTISLDDDYQHRVVGLIIEWGLRIWGIAGAVLSVMPFFRCVAFFRDERPALVHELGLLKAERARLDAAQETEATSLQNSVIDDQIS